MSIPLDIVKSKDELNSSFTRNVKCSVLDSIAYINNDPDEMIIYSTPAAVDFTKNIEPYSLEYYSIYTVHCIDEAIKYYNGLFDNSIDFNSQEKYRSVEVTLGDVPYLTTPRSFIFEEGSNPSPSLFYHELGHRAFWYLEDNLGVKFNGLTYIHMGLLEYFTVSLNDSPVVGEDALPERTIRDASRLYTYPPDSSSDLGHLLDKLKDSYPEDIKNPESNISKYYNANVESYKDYLHIIDNHSEGMIITSTLWRIREHLGKEKTDNLVSETILELNDYMMQRRSFYTAEEELPDRVEWYDLYFGLISMNRILNGGGKEEIFIREFTRTGFPTEKIDIR